jgi:hypothetical protein
VTIVIEDYSAKRREADIRSGILDSILGKIIHPALWDEIKSSVLSGAICDTWNLELAVSKEPVTVSPTSRLRCPDRLPCDASRRAPTNPPVIRPAERIRALASNRPWHPTTIQRGRV